MSRIVAAARNVNHGDLIGGACLWILMWALPWVLAGWAAIR